MKKLMRRSTEASAAPSRVDSLPLIPSGSCFGEGCEAVEPWPVHQIRHRNNVFLRLCSSCVLKYHPGSFCCSCFQILDSADRPPLVHCSKCPSLAHLCCLPDPSMAPLYICPACDSPSPTSFSYFPYSKISADRVIDLRAAKILLAAARLSAASMSRAAAIARVDAEKKVKEAALARKRARDMLDRSSVVFEKEKEKEKEKIKDSAKVEAAEPKKKGPRPSCTVTVGAAVQKRAQEREREKWKRFSEPIGLVNRSTVVVGGSEKIKGILNSDVNVSVVKDEKEKKGAVSGSPVGIGKQE